MEIGIAGSEGRAVTLLVQWSLANAMHHQGAKCKITPEKARGGSPAPGDGVVQQSSESLKGLRVTAEGQQTGSWWCWGTGCHWCGLGLDPSIAVVRDRCCSLCFCSWGAIAAGFGVLGVRKGTGAGVQYLTSWATPSDCGSLNQQPFLDLATCPHPGSALPVPAARAVGSEAGLGFRPRMWLRRGHVFICYHFPS